MTRLSTDFLSYYHVREDYYGRLSRRAFLNGLTILAATAGGASWLGVAPVTLMTSAFAQDSASSDKREFLATCDTDYVPQGGPYNGAVVVTNPGRIKTLNVATGKIEVTDLPFFGHAVTQNPGRPAQLASFEKWGLRGALIDSQSQTILTSAAPADGNLFFGHAAFSADGASMMTTEDSIDRSGGQLVLRDAVTLKIIEKRSSYGARPHECRSPDKGKTIVTVNQGDKSQQGSVTWVDWQSGKLLNKIAVDPKVRYGYSHIDFAPDGWMCLGGSMEPAGLRIAFISPDGKFLLPNLPTEAAARIKGEALSIALLGNTGLVAVTILASAMIMVFDYKTQTLTAIIDCKQPKGILPAFTSTGKAGMYFTSQKNDEMFFVDVSDAQPRFMNNGFGGNGSHMNRFFI